MKRQIEILEVSPRDGLQGEKSVVSTADKLALIKQAIEAGLRRIEVTSFVNPARVPQMADAEQLVSRLPDVDGVSYTGLVLNHKGFQRAKALSLDEIGCVIVASETFNKRNQGVSIDQTLSDWYKISKDAHRVGIRPQITIAAAFGCPFEGDIAAFSVIALAKKVAKAGPSEIGLADTIGVAVPTQVKDLVSALKNELPDIRLRGHFHNSRNTGFANAYAAVEAGIDTLDSSIGGIGGCPFAPNATGNISTDDLVYMLDRMGVVTGVDLEKIIKISLWLENLLKKPVPSQVSKSGIFPPKNIQTN